MSNLRKNPLAAPSRNVAYRGYLLIRFNAATPYFYIQKDGVHIGGGPSLDAAKREVDGLLDPWGGLDRAAEQLSDG